MDDVSSDMRSKFVESLMQMIDQGVETLGEKPVAEILWEALVDLDPATFRFRSQYAVCEGTPTLTLNYQGPMALELDMKRLVDVGGLMVEVDPVPPLMEPLAVVVTGESITDEVLLSGRAVHHSDGQLAVELNSVDSECHDRLEALVDKMSAADDASPEAGSLASTFSTVGAGVGESVGQQPSESDDEDIPVVDQLVEHADDADEMWQLDQSAVEPLLREVADVEGYAVLEVDTGDASTIQYIVHYGRLIDVRRESPEDDQQPLVDRLISMGHISAEEHERAGVLASIHGISIQDALVDMAAISLEELHEAIRMRLVSQLETLRQLDSGQLRLYRLEQRPPLRLRRSAVDLIRHVERWEQEGGEGPVGAFADGETSTLTLEYPTAGALRRDLDDLVRKRGMMVNVDARVPLMETLEIVVAGDGANSQVTLKGRAVHRSHEGVAVQLFPVGENKRRRLTQLAEAMDSQPAASTDAESTSESEETRRDDSDERDESEAPVVDRLVDHCGDAEMVWELDDHGLEEIFHHLLDVEEYGVLEVEAAGAETIQYVLHSGRVIDVRRQAATDQDQRMVYKLVARGTISEEDVNRAEVLASIHGISVQDALVDIGCITLEQLIEVIRARLVDELDELWSYDVRQARLYLLDRRPPLRLRRSAVELFEYLVDRIRRRLAKLSEDQIDEHRERFADHRLSCSLPVGMDVDSMGLDGAERRFVEVVLDEPRSWFELQRIAKLNEEAMVRMLLLLEQIDALELSAKEMRPPEYDEVKGMHKRLARGNHFDVLGVHWSAFGDEIEAAYKKMRDKLDVPQTVEKQLGEELKALRQAVSTAYATLKDPDRRRAYRNEQIDDFAQKSALDVYTGQIDSLKMRDDKTELIDRLARIAELDPNNTKARRQYEALKYVRESDR